MIRKEWLIPLIIAIIAVSFMYYAERKDNDRLRKELEEVEVIIETPIKENKEIKEITIGIDSTEHEREKLRREYEKDRISYTTGNIDSLVMFFEGYVSDYRFRKNSGE